MLRARCLTMLLVSALAGCAAFPDVVRQPQFHNPFPQLHSVAVLPFANQSNEPTVDGELVATIYATQLQQIPGFEVVPVGVVKRALTDGKIALEGPPEAARAELRRLGRLLKVDAVVIGSVTDYSPYYPPRLGLAVDWYAVNPNFHPIPPGYGLPWGTPEEEFIPHSLVREAEFALAREQLKTQTPPNPEIAPEVGRGAPMASPEIVMDESKLAMGPGVVGAVESGLPPNWPDPAGFIPPPPSAVPPPSRPQTQPIMSQVRQYNANNADFTEALAQYYYFQDDARFGGWQGYLQRSEDFLAFCCYLHITEMLGARGGAGEPRVVWRWPIGRYER